jgi:hypothetical protein
LVSEHLSRRLVISHADELGMAQQTIASPLHERHLRRNAVMSSALVASPQWPVLLLVRFANGYFD